MNFCIVEIILFMVENHLNVFLRVGLSWIWITFRVDGNVRLGKKDKLS